MIMVMVMMMMTLIRRVCTCSNAANMCSAGFDGPTHATAPLSLLLWWFWWRFFVGGLIGEIGPTNKLDFFPQPVDADVSSQSMFLGGLRTAKCQENKNWTLESKNIEKSSRSSWRVLSITVSFDITKVWKRHQRTGILTYRLVGHQLHMNLIEAICTPYFTFSTPLNTYKH